MNKHVKFALISVVLLSASIGFGQQRGSAPVEFQKLSDRLYQSLGGSGAQGGVYIGDDAVLVIDAKMNEASVKQVIERIAKLTDKPIKYLVNTHADSDHIVGNRFFPKTVTFIGHENCRKEFFLPGRDGGPSEWSSPELAPFVPSVTFSDKMTLYLGATRVELWYFGVGHTTGDIVLYFPEEKTAFIGDQIFIGRAQLIHSYKGGNSFEHVKTLSKMLETLDAEKFCSGHSVIATRKDIADHIEQMKQLQAKVKSLTEQGKSLADVQAEFDQSQARLIESICNELKAGSTQ